MPFSATLPTDLYSEAVAAIRREQRFLVISHVRPDGDAVGSVTGLARALRKAGKEARIGLADPPPERFSFLLAGESILRPGEAFDPPDVIVLLDTGDLPRTGFQKECEAFAGLTINVDHHGSNTRFGKVNVLDFEASSTCEMVVGLIQAAGLPFDPEVAEGLFLGLLTDSRFFQNENLRPTAHDTAAALLRTGLNTGPILSRLNSSRTLKELKVLGLGLGKIRLEMDGRLATFELSQAELQSVGGSMAEVFSAGLWGQLTSLQGVVVGVGILEGPDGKTFCEFRSREGFNVQEIAIALGGGGHLAASGCNQTLPMAEMAAKALAMVRERLAVFPVGGGRP